MNKWIKPRNIDFPPFLDNLCQMLVIPYILSSACWDASHAHTIFLLTHTVHVHGHSHIQKHKDISYTHTPVHTSTQFQSCLPCAAHDQSPPTDIFHLWASRSSLTVHLPFSIGLFLSLCLISVVFWISTLCWSRSVSWLQHCDSRLSSSNAVLFYLFFLCIF